MASGEAGRMAGRLISTQIRRVKRFCLLCVFGLIISKLDPTRRRQGLTVTVRTSRASPQMPRFAMGMFGLFGGSFDQGFIDGSGERTSFK